MQRGVLELTRSEMAALMKSFDVTRYEGMHLVHKLEAGKNTDTDPVTLEISEEELEVLLDEAGVPIPGETQEMITVRTKLNTLMTKFRSAF